MHSACLNRIRCRRSTRATGVLTVLCAAAVALLAVSVQAQETQGSQAAPDPSNAAQSNRVSCQSQPGERQHCSADTSAGVALVSSSGAAPCLLGKTWGYDDTGIWVSDGCSGEFVAGQTTQQAEKKKPLEYVPNQGFLLYDGEKG